MAIVDEIERIGCIPDVSEQLVAGDSCKASLAALVEAGLETPLGQLGHDHQAAVDDFDPFDRQQKRMTDLFDPAERFELTLSTGFVQSAVNEFNGLPQPSRAFGFPDLSITAAAQTRLEHVAGNRLVSRAVGPTAGVKISMGRQFGGFRTSKR